MTIANIAREWELVGELRVKKFEKEFGYGFPDDYFSFLVKQNGGRIRPPVLYVFNKKNVHTDGSLRVLYGIGAQPSTCSIENTIDIFQKREKRIPEYLLPIGSDGSNRICIILDKKRFGEIIYWEMASEIEFDEDTDQWMKDPMSNCYPIAKTFTEFLESLKPDKV